MATTTPPLAASTRALGVAELAENIFSYSERSELFALALTSKSVSESALDVLWTNVSTLKDLFLIIPGCFEDDYELVRTSSFFFFLSCLSTKV